MLKLKTFFIGVLWTMLFVSGGAAVGDNVLPSGTTTESGMCDIDVIGVSSNTARTVAVFAANEYTCYVGNYLPADAVECEPCPANSYCGGGTYSYNETAHQGINVCPNEYPLSNAASSVITECYRNCTTSDVANSASVTGRYYYDSVNMCEPTDTNSCNVGYHRAAGQTPMLPDVEVASNAAQWRSHKFSGYTNNGDSDLYYGEWKTSWTIEENTKGTMKGNSSCNNISGSFASSFIDYDLMTGSVTGQYCWCRAISWTPYGESETKLIAKWLFRYDRGSEDDCANYCSYLCAGGVRNDSTYRRAMFRAIIGEPASCQINTITLNWGGYGANNDQSQQTQCTYGGGFDTPTYAPTRRGYTFNGWQFIDVN